MLKRLQLQVGVKPEDIHLPMMTIMMINLQQWRKPPHATTESPTLPAVRPYLPNQQHDDDNQDDDQDGLDDDDQDGGDDDFDADNSDTRHIQYTSTELAHCSSTFLCVRVGQHRNPNLNSSRVRTRSKIHLS